MTPKRTAHRYERRGILAIEPSAFFELFFSPPSAPANEELAEATVVSIRGPLDQHDEGWCDSYESILARVEAACAAPPPAVMLRIDSPGGDASGCLECSREIRSMCERSGKQLIAYAEGKCASAAYAIACAADRIVMSETAIVGSIGVLSTRPDYSVQNAARGFRMGFVASGARKIDGHPDVAITEDEVRAEQELVDSLAHVFFELVAERRGTSVEAVAGLQAGVFHGDAARTAGLGDETLTIKATLASLASWSQPTEEAQAMKPKLKAEDDKKPDSDGDDENPFESVRSRLKKMSEGDDANAKAAKRALAELEKEDETAEGAEPEPAAAATAASSEGLTLEEVYRAALAAEARSAKLEKKLAQRDEAAERDALIAKHPSLPKSMVALLRKSPLKLVQETLADFEPDEPAAPAATTRKPGVSAKQALASVTSTARQPLRGKHAQPGSAATMHRPGEPGEDGASPEEIAHIDRHMGLITKAPKVGSIVHKPHRLTLGGVVGPDDEPEENADDDEADAQRAAAVAH